MKRMIWAALMLPSLLIPAAAQQEPYIIEKGDTLWGIADRCYGDPSKWKEIYEANKPLVKDPDWIYIGRTIELPKGDCQSIQPQRPEAEEVKADRTGPFTEEKPANMQAVTSAAPTAKDKKAKKKKNRKTAGPKPTVDSLDMPDTPSDVPEEMPVDMAWGMPSTDSQVVSPDWTEDGVITAANINDEDDDLAAEGDRIAIKITSGVKVAAGDVLASYRRINYTTDVNGRKTGMAIQRSALLKVVKVKGRKIQADIVRLITPVSSGEVVKRLEGGE